MLLQVDNLSVTLSSAGRLVRPVDGVTFSLVGGETFALLGESGCGKSMTASALLRLLPANGRITQGQICLEGDNLLAYPEARMRGVRGGQMAMIFQEPSTSLNPVMTVGTQLGEVLSLHRGLAGEAAQAEIRRLLDAVGIPDSSRRMNEYPFQMSGGMKQRVMIAMALAGEPQVLIADEPTTALDVTLQAQVLSLLRDAQRQRGMAMLLITHDLGVVAETAQRVGVMYAGQLVEQGSRDALFRRPRHPYTQALFAALPGRDKLGQPLHALPGYVPPLHTEWQGCRFANRCAQAQPVCQQQVPGWHEVDGQQVRCHQYDPELHSVWANPALHPQATHAPASATLTPVQPLLDVRGLQVHFPIRQGLLRRVVGHVKAVDGIDLQVWPGQTTALVGESGCGKTTAGRAILQLVPPTGGEVRFAGQPVSADASSLRTLRRDLQVVFQDPFASLNPRMQVGEILAEGMQALGIEPDAAQREARVCALLERVGLDPQARWRYPHEFSGGQRQRIAIARALAVQPRLIVCDEPTSALDVSVQAQILNLFRELQRSEDLAYLFITHNLAVVDYLADRVAVMYLGRIVEQGPARVVLDHPAHPYTRMLLAAVPRVDADDHQSDSATLLPQPHAALELPSPANPPQGCHFHPRCPQASARCRQEYPPVHEDRHGRQIRCFIIG